VKKSGASYEAFAIEAPPRPIIALQVLARILRDSVGKLSLSEEEALKIPSFEIYTLYLGLWLQIKVGDKNDEFEFAAGYRQMLMYLQIVKRKWKIAGKIHRNCGVMKNLLILCSWNRGVCCRALRLAS
jgi:hypothetical protein